MIFGAKSDPFFFHSNPFGRMKFVQPSQSSQLSAFLCIAFVVCVWLTRQGRRRETERDGEKCESQCWWVWSLFSLAITLTLFLDSFTRLIWLLSSFSSSIVFFLAIREMQFLHFFITHLPSLHTHTHTNSWSRPTPPPCSPGCASVICQCHELGHRSQPRSFARLLPLLSSSKGSTTLPLPTLLSLSLSLSLSLPSKHSGQSCSLLPSFPFFCAWPLFVFVYTLFDLFFFAFCAPFDNIFRTWRYPRYSPFFGFQAFSAAIILRKSVFLGQNSNFRYESRSITLIKIFMFVAIKFIFFFCVCLTLSLFLSWIHFVTVLLLVLAGLHFGHDFRSRISYSHFFSCFTSCV